MSQESSLLGAAAAADKQRDVDEKAARDNLAAVTAQRDALVLANGAHDALVADTVKERDKLAADLATVTAERDAFEATAIATKQERTDAYGLCVEKDEKIADLEAVAVENATEISRLNGVVIDLKRMSLLARSLREIADQIAPSASIDTTPVEGFHDEP